MATRAEPNKMELITRNLQEVLNPQIIEGIVVEGRDPRIYWGTATTGKPHVGYLVPMAKIADFLAAGCSVVVLLADLHGFLDSVKVPIEIIDHRLRYYEKAIKTLLTSIGVSIERLEFVVGRSYQLTADYTLDLLRLSNVTSQNDAKRAGAEVVKQTDNPALSGLIYPLMQALDEEYLKVDVQFGGIDQRKIFVLAEEHLPQIGYKKRAHLMNPMVPGLTQNGKMSASDPNSKIDLVEDPASVKKKIAKAFAAPGVVEGNGLLGFLQYVVFPISDIKQGKPTFHINRDEKWGGPITYHDIESVKKDYADEKLSPADLKLGMVDAINEILAPIRAALLNDPEFAEIEQKAYPSAEAKVKKVKKVKNKGTQYPVDAGGSRGPSDSQGPSLSAESTEAFETLTTKTETLGLSKDTGKN